MRLKISKSNVICFFLILCTISDIIFSGFVIGIANPRTLIILGITLLCIMSLFTKWKIEKHVVKVFKLTWPVLPFIFISIHVDILASGNYLESVKWAGTVISIYLVSIYIIIFARNEKQIAYIETTILICVLISSIFAILQLFYGGYFFDIREVLSKQMDVTRGNIFRYPGLSKTYIHFSYQLSSVLSIIFAYLISSSGIKWTKKIILIIPFLILFIALGLNFTRSAIISFFITTFILTVLCKSKHIISLSLITLLSIGIYSNYYIDENLEVLTLTDESARSRFPRLLSATSTIIQNPFGYGQAVLSDKKTYNFDRIFNFVPRYTSNSYSPHNHFLTVAVAYGVLCFIFLFIFFIKIFRYILYYYKLTNKMKLPSKIYALAGLAFLISYVINMSFHNYGPFIGEKTFWYLLGIIIARLQLISNRDYEILKNPLNLYIKSV